MGILDLFDKFRPKALISRPAMDIDEGRYFLATVTPDDKAQRVYTYNPTQADLLLRATGYVSICAAMNAQYCASVPIRLYTKSGKGRKVKSRERLWLKRGVQGKAAAYANQTDDIVEVMDSPATALLANPNVDDIGIQFRRLTHFFLEINGNAFWQHDASASAPPKNLLTLYPQWTMPTIDDTGIVGWRYGRNQTSQEYVPVSNVVQFKHMPSPQNPWLGVGCLNAITTEADIYASAIVYEQSFWNNSARPDFAVKLPTGSTVEQVKQAHAMLERRHQGARKSGKPIVTTGDDLVVTPLQWSPREMEYGEGIDRMRRVILNAFGIPLPLLEMTDGSLGGGGREFESRAQYMRQTISPRMSSLCERLTESLLPTFGLEPGRYWFAYDNPDIEDEEKESRDDVEAAVMTINEARALRGYEPKPEGDALRYHGKTLEMMDKPPEPKIMPGAIPPKEKTYYSRSMFGGKGNIPGV